MMFHSSYFIGWVFLNFGTFNLLILWCLSQLRHTLPGCFKKTAILHEKNVSVCCVPAMLAAPGPVGVPRVSSVADTPPTSPGPAPAPPPAEGGAQAGMKKSASDSHVASPVQPSSRRSSNPILGSVKHKVSWENLTISPASRTADCVVSCLVLQVLWIRICFWGLPILLVHYNRTPNLGLRNAWYISIQMKPQQITITLLYLYTIHKILCSVRGESLRPLAPVL